MNPQAGDRVRMHDGSPAHITEVRRDEVVIQGDGILGFQPILLDIDMLHKVVYRPDPIAKISFYWQIVFGDD